MGVAINISDCSFCDLALHTLGLLTLEGPGIGDISAIEWVTEVLVGVGKV